MNVKKILIAALMVLLLLASFLFGGCGSKDSNQEGFAIYLTRDNIPVAQMAAMSHVEIAAAPFIAASDIVAYSWGKHEIQLTPEAFKRLDSLQIPTIGTSFVICVDKALIYWGAFWAGYSSQSFDGITIWLKPTLAGENRIQITQGYPSSNFYNGDDPRNNPVIKDALEKAGKLK